MRRRAVALMILAISIACVAWGSVYLSGQARGPEAQVIDRAAEALGGKSRILAVKTIQVIGYGQQAAQNGGGNISGSPDAPMKWQNVLDYHRTIALDRGRMRTEQRVKSNFVFAVAGQQLGLNRADQVVDLETGARQARLDALTNPVVAVRAALDPATKLSNLRRGGAGQNVQLVDLTLKQGDSLTLGIDATSNLPSSVAYVVGNGNLGDLTLTTKYSGWAPVNGVQLPMGYTTTGDWRNIVQSTLFVDRNIVDEPIEDIVSPAPGAGGARGGAGAAGAAAAGGRGAAAGAGGAGGGQAAPLQATKVADHVWYSGGSTIFEFDDHMTMFEAYGGDARVQALVTLANSLVPGKRLTQLIVSHHHFDHSAGLRAAVAQGLTIISRRGNEGIFREMTSRPATQFPDALGRNPQPLKFMPVDDHLKLKDGTNEVDIYHVIANNHMADGVLAHVPASGLLVEGDLTTQNWDYQWWGGSYMDNIDYRKIKVTTNLAVHATQPFPIAEIVAAIEKQVRGAQELCARAAAAQFFQPGCPVQYTRKLSGSN